MDPHDPNEMNQPSSPWWSRIDDPQNPAEAPTYAPPGSGDVVETAHVDAPPTAPLPAAEGPLTGPETPRRPGFRRAAALTAAAVVVSAAASGAVVHVVDDHSGRQSAAPTASVTKTNATTATPG